MHLLYIIKDPYPTNRPDVLVMFGRRLAARGITSDIVGQAGADGADATAWPAGRHFVTSNHGPRMVALARGFLAEWKRFSRPTGYDAIVFRDRTLSAAAALLYARRNSAPIHYWMSYPFPEDDLVRSRVSLRGPLFKLALRLRGQLFRWMLYRFVIPRASHVFVQSQRMLEVVVERSGRTSGLTAVPMGVDETMLDAPEVRGPSRPMQVGDVFSLVYLGSLDRARNIDFLLDVMVELQRRAPDVPMHLTLVGGASSPDEFEWLADRIRQMQLVDRVTMTGPMPMRDAWVRCRQCHVGLSAIPRGELFDVSSPTKTVEYIAMALPVVVNDIPDQKLLVDATGAGVCTRMTAVDFAEAILQVRARHAHYAAAALQARPWVTSHRGYESLSDMVAERLTNATRGQAASMSTHAVAE